MTELVTELVHHVHTGQIVRKVQKERSARARVRDPRPLLAKLGATPAEIDFIIERVEANPAILDAYAYVRKAGRDLLDGHRLNGHRAAPPRGRNADPVRALAAPPCPECGEPYTPAQLADPEFRLAALRGEAGCIHEPSPARPATTTTEEHTE